MYVRKIRGAAALFTDEEVRGIRRADFIGLVSRTEQARMFGVGKATIDRICRRETYDWVSEDPTYSSGPFCPIVISTDAVYTYREERFRTESAGVLVNTIIDNSAFERRVFINTDLIRS